MANRVRLTKRPKDPKDLDFELDQQFLEDQIPNFKTLDVYASGQRHLLVYSEHQLELLSKAKTWYMDSTFHVVKKPWTQLLSIHAFI